MPPDCDPVSRALASHGAAPGAEDISGSIALDDPQKHFGIAKAKQMLTMVIATNKDQALRDLYGDLMTIILEAPCFKPYIGRRGASVRLRTPADMRERPRGQGSLLVEAQATTATAGRGPVAMVLLFDEVAHARDDGMVNGADEVYRAAAPALAQFPSHSLTIMASSPASQTGEFYAAYRHAMAIDEHAQLIDATSIAVVLRSWDVYYGWERAHEIPMWPGGPCYEPKAGPVISPDSPTVVAVWPRIVTYDPFDSSYAVDILQQRLREVGMLGRVLIKVRPTPSRPTILTPSDSESCCPNAASTLPGMH